MITLSEITLKGIRGVKEDLTLRLDGKSTLLYGDSGAGKSSIADSFEWFFKDRINHITGEEIGGKTGLLEAIRNVLNSEKESSSVNILFSKEEFNSNRGISQKSGGLVCSYSNNSIEFKDFISSIQKENLIFRNTDLAKFILDSKKERLDSLSEIIGFSEITKIRDILKKILNDLKRTIQIKDFNNQINQKQSYIIENLKQNINSDEQLLEVINNLLKPFGIKQNIIKIQDINPVLKTLTGPDNTKIIENRSFISNIKDYFSSIKSKLNYIEESYSDYYIKYKKILSDVNKLSKIVLENLLSEGLRVIREGLYQEDSCPLCLKPIKREDLIKDIENRRDSLVEIKKEKNELLSLKENMILQINSLNQSVKRFLELELINEHYDLKSLINLFNLSINKLLEESKRDFMKAEEILEVNKLKFDEQLIEKILNYCITKLRNIEDSLKVDERFNIISDILLSSEKYNEKKKLEKEKGILENQKSSFNLFYSDFIKRQKEGFESFLENLSKDINNYYQYMNPDEKVEDIKIITVADDDELQGLAIQFKFLNLINITPPNKYLSESHLNCLGLAFYLTSVEAFNKNCNFFFLDDVISSFDSNHRKKFADLLIEKFNDYQIIVLTHEKNLFEYFKNKVKGKNWILGLIKYNNEKGTHLDESPKNLKESIEDRLNNSNQIGLGNDIRSYLEHLSKEISFNLELKVNFLYNDKNEERMSFELLSSLKNKINKHSKDSVDCKKSIDKMLESTFIGSKNSHDSRYETSIGDLKSFWEDVENLENFYYCKDCNSYVSVLNYNRTENKVTCKNGCKFLKWIN